MKFKDLVESVDRFMRESNDADKRYNIEINGTDQEYAYTYSEMLAYLKKWNKNTPMKDEDGEVVTFDQIIRGTAPSKIYCATMVERGDDWVDIDVFDVKP